MPLILLTLAVYFCAGTLVAGDEESPVDEATGLLDKQLTTLRATLPQATCLAVTFDEQRSFPFQSQPRKLSGRLLRDLESGRFVFDYEKPRRLKLIYNDGIVSLLRGNRAPEELPEATVSLSLFAALFKDDVIALTEDWTIRTEYSEGTPFFRLIPKSPAAKESYRRVDLIFSENALRQVVVVRENAVEHRYIFDLPQPLDYQEFEAIFE